MAGIVSAAPTIAQAEPRSSLSAGALVVSDGGQPRAVTPALALAVGYVLHGSSWRVIPAARVGWSAVATPLATFEQEIAIERRVLGLTVGGSLGGAELAVADHGRRAFLIGASFATSVARPVTPYLDLAIGVRWIQIAEVRLLTTVLELRYPP